MTNHNDSPLSREHCECADPSCISHPTEYRCNAPVDVRIYPLSGDDLHGMEMCEDCANNACESGNFIRWDEIEEGTFPAGNPCAECSRSYGPNYGGKCVHA